ncbi:MAG: FtsX-like permease family protein [bacterium]
MFKHYLKIALRNLRKHKTYSFINIAGLATGLACCILILLYVRDELDYDRYHQNASHIYRVLLEMPTPVAPISASTPIVLAPKLQEAFPEIQAITRLERYFSNATVSRGDKQFTETRFFMADPSIFQIFSFQLIHGDANTALAKPYSVILTTSTAQRYFGAENPLLQEIELVGKGRFIVTGVMDDLPAQSHFHFDFLASLSSIGEIKSPWDHWGYTYVLLPENLSPAALESKFSSIANYERLGWWVQDMKFHLQPLTEIHLHSHFHSEIEANNDVRYIYIFSVIAALILLIACMNYMNMATAKSTPRAKEVGIRKVVGSRRWNLAAQFLGESVLYSSLAVVLAFIFVELLLPAFSNLVQKQLAVKYFQEGWLLAGCLGLALFTGLISGSYPAFYLSAFQPAPVLKGLTQRGAGAIGVRRILVLAQFTMAVGLITGTVVVQKQLNFIRDKKLGFAKENIIVLPIWGTAIKKQCAIFKNALLQHPSILRATAASGGPIDGAGVISSLKNSPLQIMVADADYLPTLGIELTQGRNFSSEFSTDSSAFLLNETAVKLLEWKNPLAETFTGGFKIEEGLVIGVVKDFHNKSLHAPIEPMVFQYDPSRFTKLLLKVNSENLPATLAFIKQQWEIFERVRPFEYSFLDDDFDKLYRSEQRVSKFFISFSALAIFIACLGLFGLTAFAAEQRTKEIGIRKVLGASVAGIAGLLSSEFAKLVLVANIVAWPIAYYAMNRWLQDFAYRIEIGWWTFALAGGAALLIALLTVSAQAIRAALANPVEALRYE